MHGNDTDSDVGFDASGRGGFVVSLLTVILAAIGLLSTGCGEPTGRLSVQEAEPVTTAVDSIRGGDIERDLKGVVGFTASGFDDGSTSLCSGTLIAPNLVMTAQHCIAESSLDPDGSNGCGPDASFGEPISPDGISLSTDTRIVNEDGTIPDDVDFRNVSEIVTPPGSDGTFCGRDIALLVLEQPIPSSEAETITPRLDDAISVGEGFTSVGYGNSEVVNGEQQGFGARRSLSNREVLEKIEQTVPITQNGNTDDRTVFDVLGNAQSCSGDSGASAIDSQGRAFGTLSRGTAGCAETVYTSTVQWSDFIRNVTQRAVDRAGLEAPSFLDSKDGGGNGDGAKGDGGNDGADDGGNAPGDGGNDGADGDEADDNDPEGGNAPETCEEIAQCRNNCDDRSCAIDCLVEAPALAQHQFVSVLACFRVNRCDESDDPTACLRDNCRSQLRACLLSD